MRHSEVGSFVCFLNPSDVNVMINGIARLSRFNTINAVLRDEYLISESIQLCKAAITLFENDNLTFFLCV